MGSWSYRQGPINTPRGSLLACIGGDPAAACCARPAQVPLAPRVPRPNARKSCTHLPTSAPAHWQSGAPVVIPLQIMATSEDVVPLTALHNPRDTLARPIRDLR